MMKFLSGVLLLLSLASCYRAAPEPAYNMDLVLPADSMISLLTDLHLAEGIVNALKNKQQTAGHLSSEYFEAVLRKHSISRETFEESMRYYAYHTEELDKIYEEIITGLSKKESLVQPVKENIKPEE